MKLFDRNKKGFTLIELLVVATIITLLASVVIYYIAVARGKGANTGVRTAFTQLRSQGNIYFSENGHYGTGQSNGSCSTSNTVFMDTKFAEILASAQSSANGQIICRNSTGANGSWVVSAPIRYAENGNSYMCADSNGVLKTHPNPITSGFTCP